MLGSKRCAAGASSTSAPTSSALGHARVTDLRESRDPAATLAAMREGVQVIVQAPLGDDVFFGVADVLLRVEVPSALGPWSYEPVDTKLPRETRAGTILQARS